MLQLSNLKPASREKQAEKAITSPSARGDERVNKRTARPPPAPYLVPEHVLMVYHAHRFIVKMKPSFPTAAISVCEKNIGRIVQWDTCHVSVFLERSFLFRVFRFHFILDQSDG